MVFVFGDIERKIINLEKLEKYTKNEFSFLFKNISPNFSLEKDPEKFFDEIKFRLMKKNIDFAKTFMVHDLYSTGVLKLSIFVNIVENELEIKNFDIEQSVCKIQNEDGAIDLCKLKQLIEKRYASN